MNIYTPTMPEIRYNPDEFITKSHKYALVGASSAWNDHSYHLLLAIEKAGYDITPIHPQESNICNLATFPSLRGLFSPEDVIIFATKDEEICMKYLREMRDNGLYKAWFEEGFTTHEMEVFATENFFQTITDYSLLSRMQSEIPSDKE